MKKKEAVTKGSGNVFVDLGYRNAEEHQTKAKLVGHIADILNERGMTQSEAAELFGIDQPKVSGLLSGHFRGFSVYRLMSFLTALGRDVEIVTKRPRHRIQAEEPGHIFVR
jgi:predicted XRE-type DNA-binding protein